MAITSQALALKAAGKDVIGLSAGEPDFDTPDHVKEAARAAMEAGETKYTAVDGTPALKEAIIQKFERENGLTFTADQISVNSGGKHSIYNCMMATLNKGDEVIIPAPYWVSYPDIVHLAEGVPVVIHAREDQGFKITPAQLEAAITPKTKWLIFNSPSNPTGSAYSKAEIQALGAVIKNHPQVWVFADDIYEHLVYDGFDFISFAAACPDIAPRVITMNGVAKAFAMTGWRIGYAAGDKDIIRAMRILQSQSTSCPSSISQAATVAALTGSMDFMAGRTKAFQKRRDYVVKQINATKGLTCPTPEGAFYVYVNIGGIIGKKTPGGQILKTDSDFVSYLLQDYLLAAVHGAAFGLSPYFRISYATSDTALETACQRIKAAVYALT